LIPSVKKIGGYAACCQWAMEGQPQMWRPPHGRDRGHSLG
jgi:hypothetical protein